MTVIGIEYYWKIPVAMPPQPTYLRSARPPWLRYPSNFAPTCIYRGKDQDVTTKPIDLKSKVRVTRPVRSSACKMQFNSTDAAPVSRPSPIIPQIIRDEDDDFNCSCSLYIPMSSKVIT